MVIGHVYMLSERRITLATPVVKFSAMLMDNLNKGTEYNVWHKLVSEAAEYYMSINPGIDSRSEYKLIGQAVLAKYPSMKREGEHPWVIN
jgi:hypothetical protein